jgi:GTP cyclohydrolase I
MKKAPPVSSNQKNTHSIKKVRVNLEKVEKGVRLILEGIGEDPRRPGILRTPERVASMFKEILGGLGEDPAVHMKVIQEEKHDEMVIIKNIPLYSMCEHHLLPFAGVAHVAYIPKGGRIVGLSKIARVVESFARRLQVQERLTKQIADLIDTRLRPLGVMVVIEAEHMCMSMRGAKKPKSLTVTSAVRGSFRSSPATRAEAITLIKGGLAGGNEP